MVSKVIEKAVALQLTPYASTHGHQLDELLQSAYKLYNATETTLVRVQNGIFFLPLTVTIQRLFYY